MAAPPEFTAGMECEDVLLVPRWGPACDVQLDPRDREAGRHGEARYQEVVMQRFTFSLAVAFIG